MCDDALKYEFTLLIAKNLISHGLCEVGHLSLVLFLVREIILRNTLTGDNGMICGLDIIIYLLDIIICGLDMQAGEYDMRAGYYDMRAGYHNMWAGYYDMWAGYYDLIF